MSPALTLITLTAAALETASKPLFPELPAGDALEQSLQEVRKLTGFDGMDTASPKFDAVLGCLQILARLDLTIVQAYLLMRFATAGDLPVETLKRDFLPPGTPMQTLGTKLEDAIAELFARGLIQIGGDGFPLTPTGRHFAATIVTCTALGEATNALRRVDAAHKA